jgi:peptidoglycan/LPS O-acetylase OafA/YrhL
MRVDPRSYFQLLDRRGRIRALDGVRGVAILLVVLHHVAESFTRGDGSLLPVGGWDAGAMLLNGWMGVQLFFVLSGFLISYHFLRRTQRAGAIGRFLVRRWLRIVPTYYVVLLIVALGLVPSYPVAPDYLSLRVGYHLLFLQDYLPSSLLGPFWSLGVEEKFYLAAPLIAAALWRARTPARGLALLAILALLPIAIRVLMVLIGTPDGRSFTGTWRNPFHLSLDALVLGAIVAWVAYHSDSFPRLTRIAGHRRFLPLASLALLLLLGVRTMPGAETVFDRVALYPLTALVMGLFVAGVVFHRSDAPLLQGPLLAAAGRIAYPWYLTHVLVMWSAWGGLRSLAPVIESLPPTLQLAVFFPFYFTGSVMAAVALHFAVEKPFLVLKDSLDREPLPAEPRLASRTA